jgi:hypothetical protein
MRGYVYVLTNLALPGLVKIGFSTKDPSLRVAELSNTSIPTPYELRYEVLTDDPYELEQSLHKDLRETGEHAGKEFFKLSVLAAINVVRSKVQSSGRSFYLETPLTSIDTELDPLGASGVNPIFKDFAIEDCADYAIPEFSQSDSAKESGFRSLTLNGDSHATFQLAWSKMGTPFFVQRYAEGVQLLARLACLGKWAAYRHLGLSLARGLPSDTNLADLSSDIGFLRFWCAPIDDRIRVATNLLQGIKLHDVAWYWCSYSEVRIIEIEEERKKFTDVESTDDEDQECDDRNQEYENKLCFWTWITLVSSDKVSRSPDGMSFPLEMEEYFYGNEENFRQITDSVISWCETNAVPLSFYTPQEEQAAREEGDKRRKPTYPLSAKLAEFKRIHYPKK